jgi:uncharacterized protein (DUF1330 family)
MAAYVIVSYDIVDKQIYEPYVPGVVPLIKKHGGEIVVGDFNAQPLEGEPHDVNVVLKFPSEKAARDWHSDPAYESLKKIRETACEHNRLVIARTAGE